jgi:hypothetical protein
MDSGAIHLRGPTSDAVVFFSSSQKRDIPKSVIFGFNEAVNKIFLAAKK